MATGSGSTAPPVGFWCPSTSPAACCPIRSRTGVSAGRRCCWISTRSGLAPADYPEAGPDGLEVAPDGTLWVAEYGAGRLLAWRAGRGLVAAIPVPAPYVTNIAFGPGGLAAVTGSFVNDRPPLPGAVWVLPADRSGRRRPRDALILHLMASPRSERGQLARCGGVGTRVATARRAHGAARLVGRRTSRDEGARDRDRSRPYPMAG